MPEHFARAFWFEAALKQLRNQCRSNLAATTAAGTTAGTASAATATTTAIVVLRATRTTTGPGGSTRNLADRHRSTVGSIEVGLVLFVYLLALFVIIVEV